jgi:Dolichyl-phosphate-mannose-protein mannosyltransferase
MSEQPPAIPETFRGSSRSPKPDARPALAAAVFIFAIAATGLYVFYSRGLTNLYGDGIAHMEGARRLFDSLTPGYQEIGTVWLPLYHLLVAPLAINDHLWQTGLAGSIVSEAAVALAGWFIFRISLEMNRSAIAAWVALAGFVLCPSMMYLASTPLTEPMMVFWTVLTIYLLFRYQISGSMAALAGASFAATLGALTRYDGWFLLPFAAVFVFFARRARIEERIRNAFFFCCLAGLGPALWLLHNAIRFGNPIEFYNGPFSAQAIYARQVATTGFRYPTDGSLLLSARYFLADLTLILGPWLLELALLGLAVWALNQRDRARRSAALLFLVPFVFYVQSMAHAAVALYVPTLFPHTYYNLRYGIEMLPAAAIFPSFLITDRLPGKIRRVLLVAILAVILAPFASGFWHGPANLPVIEESVQNTPCKAPNEQALIRFFTQHYDGGRILTTVGEWPCLNPAVGIPFHKTISEANREIWRQVRRNPEQWVEWIIRGEDDSVDEMMRARPNPFKNFELVERDKPGKEAWVEIYRRRKE